MRIIDLTHVIEPSMPVFPGTEPPLLVEANTVAKDGFAEKKLTMYSHTGTHIDAPAHMLSNGRTLDSYDASNFYGRAVLVDAMENGQARIELRHISRLEERLRKADFLILRTGWAERWGTPAYYEDFPALTVESARWITGFGLKGLGTDAISVDRMEDTDFPVHNVLFKSGFILVENLTNLDKVGMEFYLGCFPLKIKEADGAPARALAFIEE